MLHTDLPITLPQDGTPTPLPSVNTGTTQVGEAGTQGTNGQAPQGEFGLTSMLPFIGIFAVMWFLMIAPERKNRKKREAMLKELKKGDEILTNSGIYGTIVQMEENQIVRVQIADGVRVRMNIGSIQALANEPAADAEKANA